MTFLAIVSEEFVGRPDWGALMSDDDIKEIILCFEAE